MSDYTIQASSLSKSYKSGQGRIEVLRSVDFSARRGEFVAVTGPSGSGKSTLLSLLGGLELPDAGRVLVEGRDLGSLRGADLAAHRRKTFGFVFQSQDLFPSMTARENVEFPLLLAGMDAAAREARAARLLERVGLGDHAEHLPDELSGGQRQRIGIARALAADPIVLLADEPTGQLDSATSLEIVALLREVAKTENRCLVMVTHDPRVAAKADRKIGLRNGVVEGEAS